MAKKVNINNASSSWEGLWYNPQTHKYSSTVFDISALRDYKGNFRIIAMKNRFHEKDDNKPNMIFSICGVESEKAKRLEIKNDDNNEDCDEYTAVYTKEQVKNIINSYLRKYEIEEVSDITLDDYAKPHFVPLIFLDEESE